MGNSLTLAISKLSLTQKKQILGATLVCSVLVIIIIICIIVATQGSASPSTDPQGWECDPTTKQCSQKAGGTFDSQEDCRAKCASPNPQGWDCDPAAKKCSQKAGGKFDNQEDCQAKCSPDIAVKFSCDSGKCNQKPGGSFTTMKDCTDACSNKKYSCQGDGTCKVDPEGAGYSSKTACETNCQNKNVNTYSCQNGICVADSKGTLNKTQCHASCLKCQHSTLPNDDNTACDCRTVKSDTNPQWFTAAWGGTLCDTSVGNDASSCTWPKGNIVNNVTVNASGECVCADGKVPGTKHYMDGGTCSDTVGFTCSAAGLSPDTQQTLGSYNGVDSVYSTCVCKNGGIFDPATNKCDKCNCWLWTGTAFKAVTKSVPANGTCCYEQNYVPKSILCNDGSTRLAQIQDPTTKKVTAEYCIANEVGRSNGEIISSPNSNMAYSTGKFQATCKSGFTQTTHPNGSFTCMDSALVCGKDPLGCATNPQNTTPNGKPFCTSGAWVPGSAAPTKDKTCARNTSYPATGPDKTTCADGYKLETMYVDAYACIDSKKCVKVDPSKNKTLKTYPTQALCEGACLGCASDADGAPDGKPWSVCPAEFSKCVDYQLGHWGHCEKAKAYACIGNKKCAEVDPSENKTLKTYSTQALCEVECMGCAVDAGKPPDGKSWSVCPAEFSKCVGYQPGKGWGNCTATGSSA